MKNLLCLLVILFVTASCANGTKENKYPKTKEERELERVGKLTGENGLVLFGGSKKRSRSTADAINVNSYLWRAVLDAVYFMPLISADPFGGTILTDWYATEPHAKERFKFNIMIVGAELRADALKISVFKQVKKGSTWEDVKANHQIAQELEEKILLRARALKVNDL